MIRINNDCYSPMKPNMWKQREREGGTEGGGERNDDENKPLNGTCGDEEQKQGGCC